MQFQGKPCGTFQDDACVVGTDVIVTLELRDDARTHQVICRVTGEALADVAPARAPLDQRMTIQVFSGFREDIRDAANRKLMAGQFEPDRSIMVRTADLEDQIARRSWRIRTLRGRGELLER